MESRKSQLRVDEAIEVLWDSLGTPTIDRYTALIQASQANCGPEQETQPTSAGVLSWSQVLASTSVDRLRRDGLRAGELH